MSFHVEGEEAVMVVVPEPSLATLSRSLPREVGGPFSCPHTVEETGSGIIPLLAWGWGMVKPRPAAFEFWHLVVV